MRRIALLLLAAGCSATPTFSPGVWVESVDELPADAVQVVSAVAALPECDAVRGPGLVDWRNRVTCAGLPGVRSCAHLAEVPPRVEVVYSASAWDGPPQSPKVSSLAFQLCRVCGYTDGADADAQASACAMRAWWLSRPPAQLGGNGWQQVASEPPEGTQEVVAAVGALAECGLVAAGGVINWRANATCGTPLPVAGCTYPWESRIEMAYVSSAWDGTPDSPGVSTLAHELCHMCGYQGGPDRGEADANACALRAQALAGR